MSKQKHKQGRQGQEKQTKKTRELLTFPDFLVLVPLVLLGLAMPAFAGAKMGQTVVSVIAKIILVVSWE